MNDIILEIDRLILLSWNEEDAEDMQWVLNDEVIFKVLDTPYTYILEMARSFIKNI